MKRYKTNTRLWLLLAAVLFVITWFLPIQATKDEQMPPAVFFRILVFAVTSHDRQWDIAIMAAGVLVIWTLVISLAALTAAWVIQCVVQVLRAR